MRLRDWLNRWSRAERHRRKIERELWSPLPPVPVEEVAEFDRLDEGIRLWKTGELPIVQPAVDRPGIYVYREAIGPQLPTVDEQFAAFEADPLGAELPGAPARDNAFYVDLLGEQALSQPVRADLENVTGYWTADFMKELIERGKR